VKNKIKTFSLLIIVIYINFCFNSCTTSQNVLLEGSAAEIMKEVRKQVSFPAMLEINSYGVNGPDFLKNYYGIANANGIDDYSILIPQEDNYSEVAIFKINKNKKENYDIILNAIQKRYTDLYNACIAYNPEKIYNLKNKTLLRYENAVIFTVNGENENKAILKTIKKFSKI
jgi:hypothetical protein